MACIALGLLTACNPDDAPQMNTNQDYKFDLNTPPFASQIVDLASGGNLTFTVSQPEYGLTLAPTYGLEVSLTPDFTCLHPDQEPDEEGNVVPDYYTIVPESQDHGVLVAPMSMFAVALNNLNGVFNQEQYEERGAYSGPVYVRATAYVGAGVAAEKTAAVSNVITLAHVTGYADFGSSETFLFAPGGANNWGFNTDWLVGYEGNGEGDFYHGFIYISGEFKFTFDWSVPGDYGLGEGDAIVDNEDMTYTVTLTERGGNINSDNVLEAGLYWVVVNITNPKTTDGEVAGSATLTRIQYVGITGDFNGWDAKNPTLMTDDGNFRNWTVTGGAFTSSGWKFVFNNDWTIENGKEWSINLGGDAEGLTLDGSNLNFDCSTVTLNLSSYPWTCTVQ